MPFFLYAVGLVICGATISVQCRIARLGDEEPALLGWPGFVVWMGIYVLVINMLGFVALAVLRRHAHSRAAQAFLFLVGGLSGVLSGVATGWLMHQTGLPPLAILFLFAQPPLVVMIINWLIGRFIQIQRL